MEMDNSKIRTEPESDRTERETADADSEWFFELLAELRY